LRGKQLVAIAPGSIEMATLPGELSRIAAITAELTDAGRAARRKHP
jgi:hypothetical protein